MIIPTPPESEADSDPDDDMGLTTLAALDTAVSELCQLPDESLFEYCVRTLRLSSHRLMSARIRKILGPRFIQGIRSTNLFSSVVLPSPPWSLSHFELAVIVQRVHGVYCLYEESQIMATASELEIPALEMDMAAEYVCTESGLRHIKARQSGWSRPKAQMQVREPEFPRCESRRLQSCAVM